MRPRLQAEDNSNINPDFGKNSVMKTFGYGALKKAVGAVSGTDMDSAVKQYISNRKAASAGKPKPKNGYGVTDAQVDVVKKANIDLNKKSK